MSDEGRSSGVEVEEVSPLAAAATDAAGVTLTVDVVVTDGAVVVIVALDVEKALRGGFESLRGSDAGGEVTALVVAVVVSE